MVLRNFRAGDSTLMIRTMFFRTRKSFDWQCKTWIRHLNDFLKTEPAGSVTIEEAEEFGKYAEEYGTMCYSQHKIVASSGKKLLSLLQGKNYPNLTRKRCQKFSKMDGGEKRQNLMARFRTKMSNLAIQFWGYF